MSVQAAINAFNAKVEKLSNKEFRFRCIQITNEAVRNTPVDTGRLRANWQIGFGYSPNSLIQFKGGTDKQANEAAADQSAAGRLRAAEQESPGATVCYITNNLPYAHSVESGGPTNKPRRMLARAILRVSKIL